jgi:hypothetical protein
VGWTLTVHPENPKTPAVIKTNAKTTTAFGFIQTSFQPKKGTSYIDPVKRENKKILSFIKTASYETVLNFGTLLPLNPMTDLP